jgi:hypothetical protein
MSTKPPFAPGIPNSSLKLAADFLEVARTLENLERDVASLKKHLQDPDAKPGVGARILACMLSATVLQSSLVRMQITSLAKFGER